MNYQLITDATADIPKELLLKISGLEIIPMEVALNGKVRVYGPQGDLSVEEFYQLLRNGQYGTTSQISPLTYQEIFEKYLSQGKDILYLCFSSGMSATWQNACMCMDSLKEQYPERTICCVDTLCASVGEGLLVYEAAKRWLSGESLEEVAQWTEQNKLRICHWFTVDNFEYLKKGGRVGRTTAAVGTALQIKPLLCVDKTGKLTVISKPRGRHQARDVKIKRMGKSWSPEKIRTVFVGHGDDWEEACRLKEEVEKKFPEVDCYIVPIGPIIGMHTGPGM